MRGKGRCLSLILALCALARAADGATVTAARGAEGEDGTRVVFELSGPVEHRVFSLANPDRVVIDLESSQAGSGLALTGATGPVTALRVGSRPDSGLRIVLELAQTVRPKTFLLPPADGSPYRLVVDLPAGGSAAAVRRAAPAASARRDVVVVIDAGHGGEDPGAIGRSGAREKDVVLAIARRLATEIDSQPGMRAVLVRDGDYLVPHRRRMQIAHDARADFFISIHADSHRDRDAKGATVYVLSDKGATDEAALLLARRENGEDLLGGVSLADKDQMLARVLLDLSQSAAISASTAAGQQLIRRMAAVTTMRKREVQRAPFLVLKSPDIPSVLVETAYISNPREESSLRSAKYQTALAIALRQGIVDYFAAHPPEGTRVAAAPTAAPAAAPAPARAAAAVATPVRHVISRGETLSEIAERYRVSSASIRRTNSLRNDLLRVGQVLTIPPG